MQRMLIYFSKYSIKHYMTETMNKRINNVTWLHSSTVKKRLKTLYTNQNKNKTGTWCVWLINAGGLHKKLTFSFFASLITMTSAIHSGCSLPPSIPKRTKLIIPSPSQTPQQRQCHLIYILVSLCHSYGAPLLVKAFKFWPMLGTYGHWAVRVL